MEESFAAGASVSDAWETIGHKAGLGRSTVGKRRQDWAARVAKESAAKPPLKVVPPEQEAAFVEVTSPMSASTASSELAVAAAQALTVPESAPAVEGPEKLKAVAVENAAHVQHLGGWLLVAMVARLGLHRLAQAPAERRVSADGQEEAKRLRQGAARAWQRGLRRRVEYLGAVGPISKTSCLLDDLLGPVQAADSKRANPPGVGERRRSSTDYGRLLPEPRLRAALPPLNVSA